MEFLPLLKFCNMYHNIQLLERSISAAGMNFRYPCGVNLSSGKAVKSAHGGVHFKLPQTFADAKVDSFRLHLGRGVKPESQVPPMIYAVRPGK
jgi:hypothetical protein